jgi:2-C-methyl-D-erythritol 4-phosphate cytidylyltransferase
MMQPREQLGPHVWTIVVAAGSGSRFGAAKQYEMLGSERVLDHSVRAAWHASAGVVLVLPEADLASEMRDDCVVVAGGATRSESVRAGLAHVPVDADIICVHDACRPLAGSAMFQAVIHAVSAGADAAVPGIAVTDTIKVVDDRRRVVSTPPRASLVAVQTPQAFRADKLRGAHARGGDGTDDAALIEAAGGVVVVVDGNALARKITERDDLLWARAQLATESA